MEEARLKEGDVDPINALLGLLSKSNVDIQRPEALERLQMSREDLDRVVSVCIANEWVAWTARRLLYLTPKGLGYLNNDRFRDRLAEMRREQDEHRKRSRKDARKKRAGSRLKYAGIIVGIIVGIPTIVKAAYAFIKWCVKMLP